MSEIRVAIYAPGKPGVTTNVANQLEALQGIVGGYLEAVRLPIPDLSIICNEEGAIYRLPQNIMGIRGTFFVTRNNDEGDWVSLTDADLVSIHDLFSLHSSR